MLVTVCLGDKFESWRLICNLGDWYSHQHNDFATNILNLSPLLSHQHHCHLILSKFYIFSQISLRLNTNLIKNDVSTPKWNVSTILIIWNLFYLTEFTLFIILWSRFWIWFHFFSCHEPQTSKFKFFRLEFFQNFRNFKFLFMFEREWFYGELYQILFNWLWA